MHVRRVHVRTQLMRARIGAFIARIPRPSFTTLFNVVFIALNSAIVAVAVLSSDHPTYILNLVVVLLMAFFWHKTLTWRKETEYRRRMLDLLREQQRWEWTDYG